MVLRLLTCICKINEIKKRGFSLYHKMTFGCCYDEKVNYSATVCEKCPYNSYLFHGNYYLSITCSCA